MTRPKYHRLIMKLQYLAITATICSFQAAFASPVERADNTRRGHVRGCPLDLDCRNPSELQKEFEYETFGDASNPWIEPKYPSDAKKKTVNPLDLRPDLPWLGEIRNMPDLPVVWNHRIIRYLEFYRNDPRGRNIIGTWLKRRGRYQKTIRATMAKANLPQDLVYVSMIESSYNPNTLSYAGAVGIWQFMKRAGKMYGLMIDRGVDERYDPFRSTEAVTMFWHDLYARFGSWELAMAAYNAGYGAVLHAITKYNTNDYWKLCEYENSLPWGATLYVAKTLATSIVGHNPEVFGFKNITLDPEVTFDQVTTSHSLSISSIARATGATKDEIKTLNPHLRRGQTPKVDRPYRVYLPRGTKSKFAKRYKQPKKTYYTVRAGERFEDIAKIHGVSRHKLRRNNGLRHQSEVASGQKLVVPKSSEKEKYERMREADDDLYSAGVPEGKPGSLLIVAVPDKKMSVKGTKQQFYRVVIGDSQHRIAKNLGINPHDIAKWNGLDKETHLHPRMVLQVFLPEGQKYNNVKFLDPARLHVVTAGSPEHMKISEKRIGRTRKTLKIRKKTTLAKIGKRFGLTPRDMARINKIPPSSKLVPGDSVIVYEVYDRKKSKRAARQAKRAPRRKK